MNCLLLQFPEAHQHSDKDITFDKLMDYHLEEAEFSRAVIAQAKKTIVVADHSKFGNPNCIKVGGFDQVDIVVVESTPPVAIESALREAGTAAISFK